jgi:glycosyltransferase involved in cell wall biosynthesis
MKKVFFENSIFLHQRVGGISKYISKLNNEIRKTGINSIIYCPLTINTNLKKNKKSNIFYLRFIKIPLFCTKIFYLINNLLTIIYMKLSKPDIFHFTYYNNFLLKFIKMPYVLTVYDLISEKYNYKNTRFKKSELIKKASHIICISKETRKDLIKFYKVDKKKISVIYLGVEENKELILKKKNYILFVGSRSRYKNFVNFIKAFSQSEYLVTNYKVFCFGSIKFNLGEMELFEKLKIKKNMIFKSGNEKMLDRAYQNASLFVSSSIQEGFGLTPLEAMRCGCPVICSDIPIFKEILGNSCAYINPKKIIDIQQKMESLLKSKAKQNLLIKRGFSKTEQFTWEKCSLKTINVYKKILN